MLIIQQPTVMITFVSIMNSDFSSQR